MEFQNNSVVSYHDGIASFKLGNVAYTLKFIQESDTEDVEEPQFWQITLTGSHNIGVQMTRSHLPSSMPGKFEIRPFDLLLGVEPGMVMQFAELVILGVGGLLHHLISTVNDVPDWLCKVFTIISLRKTKN